MRTLDYYFGKKSDDPEDAGPSLQSHNLQPAINIVIGKRKRPVGRPRKAPLPKRLAKLVDYSSSSQEEPSDERDEPATSKKRMHRMYSVEQKKKVAYYARHHGIRKASRRFGVHHKNVQRWVKNQVSSIKNPRKRVNRKGQGRKISYPQDLEDKLVAWILEKREEDFVAVSTQMIRLKALSLIKDTNPKFKASDGWVRKFMQRNDLVLRVRTHISQNLPSDLESKIKGFRDEARDIHKNSDYPFEYICNMDETPVYLDLVPSKVVDKKGKKTIRVRTTSSEKNRVTATLCCTAAGNFLPAFVVFKGKTQSH